MKKILILFGVAMATFLVIDLIWLGVVAQAFYQEHLGHLLAPNFKVVPAVIFYVAFVLGLVFLVLKPGIERKSYVQTLLLAALYGFATYGAYDLTNYATMIDFPIIIVVVDLIWGTVLTITTATVTYLIYKRFVTE